MNKQAKAYSYIRFSNPNQESGDSLRRQVHLSEEYAKQNSLILDNSLKLTDKGISAYKGLHRTKGALGEFLKLVEAGKIQRGSVLIVESLDRLSREHVLDALNQFTAIIRAGIKLVTLQDNMEYDLDSIKQNWTQLIISITYMARAHEESEAKSKRLAAAWENKRKKAINGEQKLTGKVPAWIKLSKDKFILKSEVCKAVDLIFKKKLAGKGVGKIERELNADSSIWKPKNGWRTSYIDRILRNRAVISEFQPHQLINGKREAVGDVIKDYYPKAIDENLFYQVQAQIRNNKQKKGNAGGETGKASNLFTHVAKCGLCNAPMHFIDKGKPPKGGKYLHCDAARRLKSCTAKAIRYEEFEKLFFDNFEELDINALIPNEEEKQSQIIELENTMTADKQRLLEIHVEIENLTDSIGHTKDARVREQLEKRLSKAFDDKEHLQSKNWQYEQEIIELKRQKEELKKDIAQSQEIYSLLEDASDESDQINLRLCLRQQIQKIIEWIKIYPLQEDYKEIQEIEPGLVKMMHSKYIEKVRMKFRGGSPYLLRALYLTGTAEVD